MRVLPKYHQHKAISTWGANTLDHCYTPFRNTCKALLRPLLSKLDHSSILLLPIYGQKLQQAPPAVRTVYCWTDQSDSVLQDCFDHVDWGMFHAASNDNIDEYTNAVTGFIQKCIRDVVPSKTIRVYTTDKPWINSNMHAALKAPNAAFVFGDDEEEFEKTCYNLQKVINAAKLKY